jgi:hypothetical protein
MTDLRVTRETLEALIQSTDPELRITREALEALITTSSPGLRITRLTVEALIVEQQVNITIESASESDTAQETILAIEPLLSLEQRPESDVAADAVLIAESVLELEPATESDLASDIVLESLIEPEFLVEAGLETDTAEDVSLATERSIILEQATGSDIAQDMMLTTEQSISLDQATESDVASAVSFVLSQATETDAAADILLTAEPSFTVEAAVETNAASDISLAAEGVLALDLAVESDTAIDIVLAPDTTAEFTIESKGPPYEIPGYVSLDGAGDSVDTPDSAQLDITGDIDIRVCAAADSWFNTGIGALNRWTLIGKWEESGNQRSWRLQIGNTNQGESRLFFVYSQDGTATGSFSSTIPSVVVGIDLTNGQPYWFRWTFDVNLGGSQHRHEAFYSTDPPETDPDLVNWVSIGSTTLSGTRTIFASTALVELGLTSGDEKQFAGKIYYAEIRNGIDGTRVANPDFRFDQADWSTGSGVDDDGNTWTLRGSTSWTAPVPVTPDLEQDIAREVLLIGPVLHDFWTGTNGDPWDSLDWDTSVVDSATVDIQSNRGHLLTSANNTYARAIGIHNPLSDCELLLLLKHEVTTGQFTTLIVLRGDGQWASDLASEAPLPGFPENGYALSRSNDGRATLFKFVDGVSQSSTTWDIGTAPILVWPADSNDRWLRMNITDEAGNPVIRAKVWLTTEVEPPGWKLEVTDISGSGFTDGVLQLRAQRGSSGSAATQVDDLFLSGSLADIEPSFNVELATESDVAVEIGAVDLLNISATIVLTLVLDTEAVALKPPEPARGLGTVQRGDHRPHIYRTKHKITRR